MVETKKKKKPLPLVVIFGRTNVGKSTLFNCLIEKRQALVSDMEETTRDSNLGEISWSGRKFTLVDTGGMVDLKHLSNKTKTTDEVGVQVQKQAFKYLKQADLVLFLLDNKSGLMPQDKELALIIKKNVDSKKIILTVNKVDAPKDRLRISEFYKLSFGEPSLVSAANGSGTGDLLDLIAKKLRFKKIKSDKDKKYLNKELPLPVADNLIKVCIIGKPNVGKSSLFNSLLGYERVIVSPTPHTTREPQHTRITYEDRPLLLIDTAGISHKGAKTYGLEKFSIGKSLSTLAKSDIALLIMDINQELTHQDARLVQEIVDRNKSFIFIANKWDLVPERDTKKYTNYLYGKMPFARYAPVQFISAKTGEKVKKIFDLILQIDQQKNITLSDSTLAHFLSRIVKTHRPTRGKGVRHPRIRDFTQISVNPPRFEIRIGPQEDLHFSYIRFIENRLRETYGFLGTPLTVQIAKNKTTHGLHQE
ncbi:MAG: ribosome biogenesis GTPase Der [bacterium]|nr:ribosome biogenesis GTPase Der [bacterium]